MDPEIDAMSSMAEALEPLDDSARQRVLTWAADKYGVEVAPGPPDRSLPSGELGHHPLSGADHYESFGELYEAADPGTEADRALVAAYWLQEHEGQVNLRSKAINDLLKDLGHKASDITRAMEDLKKRRPQPLRQLAKKGKTRQARKEFAVTDAGKKSVREMVTRGTH